MREQALIKLAYYGLLLFLATVLGSFSVTALPRSVKWAVRSEGVFATLIFLPALVLWTFQDISNISLDLFFTIFLNMLGLFWYVLVCCLLLGHKWARLSCMVLSVVRFATIIGSPFSLVTMAMLNEKEAKEYFDRNADDNPATI